MKVWLVTIGEPLPVHEGERDRLHRTGFFAHFLSNHGHEVVWWTSTFDHNRKKHVFETDTIRDINSQLRIVFMKGSGYPNNVSVARIRDHRQIGRKFRNLSAREKQIPDIVVAALPTIELCLQSIRFGEKNSVPVVLDMRDMWPDIFVDFLPSAFRPFARLAARPLFRDARTACAGATAITGITDEFVDWGLKKGLRTRTDLDRSFPMGYSSTPPSEADLRRAERFWDERGLAAEPARLTACFIGTLGRQPHLETVLKAAKVLNEQGANIQFVICGSGDRSSNFVKLGADLENVIMPGWIDAACIYVLMRRSHVGLDPLPDRYDFISTINNKAIEYLSASLPIISTPKKGTLFELLRRRKCGLSCDVRDVSALVDILRDLDANRDQLHELSRNAGETFQTMFKAEIVYSEMMKYLEDVVAQGTAPGKRRTDGEEGI